MVSLLLIRDGADAGLRKAALFAEVELGVARALRCLRRFSTVVIAVATLGGFVNEGAIGAAEASPKVALSKEEQQIRAVEKKRVAQSVAVGCLTGAIVAQLAVQGNPKFEGEIGQVLGQLGLDKKTVIAAIGCGAGKLSGDYVNSRSREYGNAQAGYKAMIAAADRDIARYKSLNDTTSRLIKQQRAKIASLNKQYKAKQITKQQYRDQIASSKDNVKVIDAQRTDLKKQVTLMKKDSKALAKSGTNPNSLNQKIVSLEKQLIALDNQRTAMVKAYNDVPPEVQRVPL